MDGQLLIDVISRILHVSTAIVLIGGSVFMAFVLLPSAEQIDTPQHEKLRGLVVGRWKRYVHLGILLFLVTGFYNFYRQLPNHRGDGLYHALIGTKILLAFGIFFIASALVGRSKAMEGMRAKRAMWLKVLVLLAAVIVIFSSFLKVRGPVTGAEEASAAEVPTSAPPS